MIRAACLLFFGLVLLPGAVSAQDSIPASTARKQIRAIRIQGAPPTLDGALGDSVWQAAPVLSDFVQKQPVEGAEPTEQTEVRFLYDDAALYVGARMFSRNPAAIQAPVSRRDNGIQAEHLWISLDTYLDRRTAYSFGVTAAGTRLDWYHPTDSETDTDLSFDPVWEARTQRDSLGWTAEMRIPFSQLRFNAGATERWGLNLDRWIASTQEDLFWVPVPSNATGWASRFGELTGITGIRPTRRVELLPYVASGATFTADPGAGNPFDDGSELTVRVGGDVKMGLGPNLTLEATVNPDFGQVEADPAEVNLSAFETFFAERRPFFTEGSQLLEGSGPAYFYSRRIGAAPRDDLLDDRDYNDLPNTSTILGAAKLTGRLASGTSVGAMAALTDEEDARTFDPETGAFDRIRVAPLTGYGVARVQQEFGASSSTAGLILTGVRRDVDANDPLAGLLNREAYSGGGDWNLRWKGGEYVLSGFAGFSYVEGDSAGILRLQRSSARYFQRPDASYLRVDPSRTSLSGYTGSLRVAREGGSHWLWEASISGDSPGFELNDVGALGSADDVFGYANLRYRETQPGPVFRNYEIGVSSENLWNFGGVRSFSAFRTDMRFTWTNFWRTTLIGWVDLRSLSDDLTRGGPLMGTPRAWQVILGGGNPLSARTRLSAQVNVGGNEAGGESLLLYTSTSVRPGPRWQLSVQPTYRWAVDPRQYVTRLAGGPVATFGDRYVFAFVDRSTLSAQLRLNYLFTPELSLEAYAEPFASSGRFYDFGELAAARSFDLRRYGSDGTTLAQPEERGEYIVTDGGAEFTLPYRDFNVRSFRSNAVLRWEWRPGSTLFLVWQQDRFGIEDRGNPVGLADLGGTLGTAGDNFLVLKLSYWLPVS